MPIFLALEKEALGIITQTTNDSLDAVCYFQLASLKCAQI
jgi:hypothetical protein